MSAYDHTQRTEHLVTVMAERLTIGVLHHLAAKLLDECGNDALVSVEIHGASGPRDDQSITFQVTS